MRTAIISYLLEYFYPFSAAELNNIESEDEIQKFSFEESDYGDSDDEDIEPLYILLNNRYFPLNESSSHY